jgi:hypothetical protein
LQERQIVKYALAITTIILSTACASSSKSSSSTARADRTTITQEEITQTGARDVLTAVQTLRPHWLNVRGASSIHQPETVKVYLDGSLLGGPQQLRQLSTQSVASIRHLTGIDASQRYGLDHGQGAILVSTRRGGS